MKHKIYMYLRIMEFKQSLEEIIERLGVHPHSAWKAGDIMNERTGKVHTHNGLELISGVDKYADFDEHIASLLKMITRQQEQFSEICNTCYTELSCVLYVYGESEDSIPAVCFDKQTLRILSSIGAEIDIDLYAL